MVCTLGKITFFCTSLLLFIFAIFTLDRHLLSHNHHFCLQNISGNLAFHPEWDSNKPPSLDLDRDVFNQKYTYLSKGRQSYVFASDDGKYVLKLLIFPIYMRPFYWISHPFSLHLHPKRKAEKALYKSEKILTTCESFKIAYEELPEQTDVLFIHLNKSPFSQKKIEIVDALGHSYFLPIEKHYFIVQKKGEHIFPTLSQMINNQKTEEAKQLIDSIISLIVSRCQKGIADRDAILEKNYGWNGKRAIHFDVGRFARDDSLKDPKAYSQEVTKIMHSVATYLAQHDPALYEYYQNKVNYSAIPH